MAATPIGPGGAPYGIPPQGRNNEFRSGSELAAEFERITPAIRDVILESGRARAAKLQGLPPELARDVAVFERALSGLREPFLEYCRHVCKSDALEALSLSDSSGDDAAQGVSQKPPDLDEQIEGLDVLIDAAQYHLEASIDGLIETHTSLGITKEFFSDWWTLNRVDAYKHEVSLDFMEEQMLNRCLNRACFLKEALEVVEDRKNEIIVSFCSDSDTIDSTQVTFEPISGELETHNRGKAALKIVLNNRGAPLINIYYKPRDARIDSRVIALFSVLNELSVENRSSTVDLPVYRIEPHLEGFSLWEYIEGDQLIGSAADEAIRRVSSAVEREALQAQLLRLESVCKFLDISDLHLENLIFEVWAKVHLRLFPLT